VFTASIDQSLRLWDLDTGKELRRLKEPNVVPDEIIEHLELSADGKVLAVGERKGLRLWDLSDRERPRDAGRIADQHGCAFSPDGKTLAIAGGHLRLLDLGTKKQLREIELTSQSARFSPDGRTLAVGCVGREVRLFDVRSWRERAVLGGDGKGPPTPLAFSPDGRLLATAQGGDLATRVLLWEVATGRLRRRIEGKGRWLDTVAFSPDGRHLALAGEDPGVLVYDLAEGRVVHTFRGHDQYVRSLAFTPDGRRLLSGSRDTTVLVWDMAAVPAPAPRETKRTARELEALWEWLAGDADDADRAMRELAVSPAQAAELLGRSLKPADRGMAERIARLIRELDSDSFDEREKASADLAELGEEAAEALRAALDGSSAEVRGRAEALLKKLLKGPSPAWLRTLRALEVLEWIGTAEARRVLDRLAGGADGAELTRAARAAVARLAARGRSR
jgi:hypothetical protein